MRASRSVGGHRRNPKITCACLARFSGLSTSLAGNQNALECCMKRAVATRPMRFRDCLAWQWNARLRWRLRRRIASTRSPFPQVLATEAVRRATGAKPGRSADGAGVSRSGSLPGTRRGRWSAGLCLDRLGRPPEPATNQGPMKCARARTCRGAVEPRVGDQLLQGASATGSARRLRWQDGDLRDRLPRRCSRGLEAALPASHAYTAPHTVSVLGPAGAPQRDPPVAPGRIVASRQGEPSW